MKSYDVCTFDIQRSSILHVGFGTGVSCVIVLLSTSPLFQAGLKEAQLTKDLVDRTFSDLLFAPRSTTSTKKLVIFKDKSTDFTFHPTLPGAGARLFPRPSQRHIE